MVSFRNRDDAGTKLSKIIKLDQIDSDPHARDKDAGKIIAVVPVAHAGSFEAVEQEANRIYCLHVDNGYSFTVASSYISFPDMTDSEVLTILDKSRERIRTL
jgi:predicted phosphoribosyltransferase